jgi:biopolymer transport protein ExbD
MASLMHKKYSRRTRKPSELLLVPMIDIFTVLVTFLLMTAVFSRITIVQLDLPSAASGKPSEPAFRLEVIMRQEGLELTNGTERIAALPKVNGEYDLKALSELVVALKRDHPQADSASVLLERSVDYDSFIQVMDAIRSTEVWPEPDLVTDLRNDAKATKVALFTKIAVGDAP